ncbi:MAG: hypothetical protein VX589_16425 [Myxococcota bacterium]|nr:hypothetical protein [Myxococcota bacterium]
MIKDFCSFLMKALMGRYDEMKWDDVFHLFILVGLSTGLLYIFI